MRIVAGLLIAALALTAPAEAQIVAKYSGIQPLDHPSSLPSSISASRSTS